MWPVSIASQTARPTELAGPAWALIGQGAKQRWLIMRKPVFGVSDQVRLKPACSATETVQRLAISAIASRGIILSRQ